MLNVELYKYNSFTILQVIIRIATSCRNFYVEPEASVCTLWIAVGDAIAGTRNVLWMSASKQRKKKTTKASFSVAA